MQTLSLQRLGHCTGGSCRRTARSRQTMASGTVLKRYPRLLQAQDFLSEEQAKLDIEQGGA